MIRFLTSLVVILLASNAFAWGRRGHAIVCETAASLLSDRAAFLKKHSFDLGYYCNVPDLVWKKPATYEIEAPQHFMDLEIFEREFAKEKHSGDPFALSRAEFEKAYPSIPVSAGRSYWRIRELTDRLHETAKHLHASRSAKEQSADQETWLVTAGVLGHYVGDLSQPLHVTEDYDGQMEEGQKGIHSWFEDQAIDELSSTTRPGKLESDVGSLAKLKWKTYSAKSAKLSTLELIEAEAKESNHDRTELMKIDKRVGRKSISKAAYAFEPLLKDRLAAGALVLAEIWSRELDWKYNGEKFYNFNGTPDYIAPEKGAANSQSTPPAAVTSPAGSTPKP